MDNKIKYNLIRDLNKERILSQTVSGIFLVGTRRNMQKHLNLVLFVALEPLET